jgi:hypothetical protein
MVLVGWAWKMVMDGMAGRQDYICNYEHDGWMNSRCMINA